MFLDDKLYQMVMEKELSHQPEILRIQLQNLIQDLYEVCGESWKDAIKDERSNKVVKACIRRSFNSWNLFIMKMTKSDRNYLIEILEKANYEKAVLSNPEVKRIYNSL